MIWMGTNDVNLRDITLSLLQRQSKQGLQYCSAYAIVRERDGGRSTTICGGSQRERHIYLSHGHAVEIRIIHSQNRDNEKHFVIKYEGNSSLYPLKVYKKMSKSS